MTKLEIAISRLEACAGNVSAAKSFGVHAVRISARTWAKAIDAYRDREYQSRTEVQIREALALIKRHISSEETDQNRDLHNAVGLIVRACRASGIFQLQ